MKRAIPTIFAAGLIFAALVALLLGVAGCGGEKEEAPAASGPAAASEAEQTTAPEPASPPEAAPSAAEPEVPPVEEEVTPALPEPEVAEPDETPSEAGPAPAEPTEEGQAAAVAVPPEPAVTESTEPVLAWERQDGSYSHCDRMSVYGDGRVIAVRCTVNVDRETVETRLSEEQAAQLNAWADQFVSFSRRESDVTRAAMRTALAGRGAAVPSTEEKAAVAKFARDLFLSLMPSS